MRAPLAPTSLKEHLAKIDSAKPVTWPHPGIILFSGAALGAGSLFLLLLALGARF